jgi:D-alanine transaminase
MSRTVFVDGTYFPEETASVSVFDRGFLFADGVYEVTAVIAGRLIDWEPHLERLQRSLRELGMPTADGAHLLGVHEELVRRNDLVEGAIYLQITRGAADRDFAWAPDMTPTIVAFTQARALVDTEQARNGVAVVTMPDLRWKRRDIKSVSLLPQALAKQEARRRGAYEAWMIEDGVVTEGASSTSFIVDGNGVLRTQPLGSHILPGTLRRAVLRLARDEGVAVEERPFALQEALRAREAMLSAATAFVLPVTSIDGAPVGDGRPGPIARRLREIYLAEATGG